MSGWTTVTVETEHVQDAEKLREAFNSATEDEYDGARDDDGERVEALIWGYGSATTMRVLTCNAHLWDTAIVMECNDTSDSGSGTVYVSEGGSTSSIDSASGVERARGHDAADQLKHHIDGRVYMR